jgi:hypothetical protein
MTLSAERERNARMSVCSEKPFGLIRSLRSTEKLAYSVALEFHFLAPLVDCCLRFAFTGLANSDANPRPPSMTRRIEVASKRS